MNFPFQDILSTILGQTPEIVAVQTLGGGSINEVQLVLTNKGPFIFKLNKADKFPGMFEKEATGLALLKSSNTIRVPEVVSSGILHNTQYLVLEYIRPGVKSASFWRLFGEQLAALHATQGPYYGLDHANYIGSLPQENTPGANWIEFFITRRLEPQVKLAVDQGKLSLSEHAVFEKVFQKLPSLLPIEQPSLLHGDLWSGNFMAGADGAPIILDPAVYYGHREAELAFTHLFGGFDEEFYASYFACLPIEKGFEQRVDIYNLYPLLIHLNLFGQSYKSEINSITSSIV